MCLSTSPAQPDGAFVCPLEVLSVALEAFDLELFQAASCYASRQAAEQAVKGWEKRLDAEVAELAVCPTLKLKLVKPRFADPEAHTLEVLVPKLEAKEPVKLIGYVGMNGRHYWLKRPTFGYYVKGRFCGRVNGELVYQPPTRIPFEAMDDLTAEFAAIRAGLTTSLPARPDQGHEVGPVESWTVIAVVAGVRQEMIFRGSIEALRRHIPDAITRKRWEQAGVTPDELSNMGVPLRIFKNRG